jgi:hypothetical protein
VTENRLTSSQNPIWHGSAGPIIAAVVSVIGALVGGALIGNSGALSDALPGNPTQTSTVTVPGPTVTTTIYGPGPTTEPTGPSGAKAVHLADSANRSPDLLVNPQMFDQPNIGIDGKKFDLGWVYPIGSSQEPQVIMGINLNRSYSSFNARLGVQDTSADSSVKMAVIADGVEIFSKVVSLRQSHDVKLPVADVQRLDIKAYTPQPNDITLAVGDPSLIP